MITRYKKRVDCQKEIPVLARVVSCVLDGTFRELKYHGDPADVDDQAMAAAQLAMLEGEEARQGWMGNYQRIAVFKANNSAAPVADVELVGRSRQFLQDQVVGHVREWIVPASAAAHQRTIGELLADAHLARGKGPAAVLLGCLELLREVKTLAEYKRYLSLLRWAAKHLDVPEQILSDIRTLNDLLAYRETGREAIVFTSTADDPKLLLLTGSLVDVSSCLDVQTGQYIDALLGYVIDANLKLVLSYGLQENDFKSPEEYAEAKRAIEAGAQTEFIPAKQQLRIGNIEINLPKARIRQVVKLGATESQAAGIRTERAYAQNYFAEREMAVQVKSILDELAAKSKAKLGEKIRIPPSRNPGGVYSDAANGAQTESYAIG